jgi:type I restriction enzyme S subunit
MWESEHTHGSTMKHINRVPFLSHQFRLVPLNEQKRIVAKIEELFSKLDAGITALERVQANLKRYRAAVLKAAVEGKLTEEWRKQNTNTEPASKLLQRILKERRQKWESEQLEKYQKSGKTPPKDWQAKYKEPSAPDTANLPYLPDGWCWATMEQIISRSEYGTSVKCTYDAQNEPVIRIPNIAKGILDLSDMKFAVTPLNLDQSSRLCIGDILVCRTNGSVSLIGKSTLVRHELTPNHSFASYLLRFRFVESEVLPNWLNLYLSSSQARKFIESNAASSAGQHNISLSLIHTMLIPLPPITEQKILIEQCQEQLSLDNEISKIIAKNTLRASCLRQSILKQAFSGKLVPQDLNDEPASLLLQRIQAEKANTIKAKPAKRQPRRKVES